jgi:hypothetical protein
VFETSKGTCRLTDHHSTRRVGIASRLAADLDAMSPHQSLCIAKEVEVKRGRVTWAASSPR